MAGKIRRLREGHQHKSGRFLALSIRIERVSELSPILFVSGSASSFPHPPSLSLPPSTRSPHIRQNLRATSGFQRYVEGPYLMITSLRNPLEVYVSAKQFLHPNQTKTLDQASVVEKATGDFMLLGGRSLCRNPIKSSGASVALNDS